jgi:hypothetical protein
VNYDKINSLFSDPGYSLLRNPFGSLNCYFLGVFAPPDINTKLGHMQSEVFSELQSDGNVLIFEGNNTEELETVNGNVLNYAENKICLNDQLWEVNIFFDKTKSGACISFEESLVFCSSLDPFYRMYLGKMVKQFEDDISDSIKNIEKFVKLLSGSIPRYFH